MICLKPLPLLVGFSFLRNLWVPWRFISMRNIEKSSLVRTHQFSVCSWLLFSFELLASALPILGTNLTSSIHASLVPVTFSSVTPQRFTQCPHPPLLPSEMVTSATLLPLSESPRSCLLSLTKPVLLTLNLFPWFPPCFLSGLSFFHSLHFFLDEPGYLLLVPATFSSLWSSQRSTPLFL